MNSEGGKRIIKYDYRRAKSNNLKPKLHFNQVRPIYFTILKDFNLIYSYFNILFKLRLHDRSLISIPRNII